MKRSFSRVLALLFLLVVAGLLWGVTSTSRELAALESVTAVQCDKPRQRVLVAARGEVRITDEEGATLGHLLEAGGEPAKVRGVSAIAAGDDGRVWIVEYPEHRVRRFAADLRFEATPVRGEDAVRASSGVLPLPSGRFVVSDTAGRAVRLYEDDGTLVRQITILYPNELMPLDGGLAVVSTGDDTLRAFDHGLEPITLPEELAELPSDGSIYEIDVDRDGAVYWNSCPRDTSCEVRRRRPGEAGPRTVASQVWLEGYDDHDPSYAFCTTSDGRVLTASQTFGAVVEFSGAVREGEEPPTGLTWEEVREGVTTGAGVRVGLFGDAELAAWIEAGRAERQALRRRVAWGRRGLGALLTLLMAVYLFDRLVGRQGRVGATVRHVASVGRDVLWPDAAAIALWAAPFFAGMLAAAFCVALLARLGVAGPVEAFALVVLCGLLVRRVTSARRLAARRSADSARRAFELYLSRDAARPLPASVALRPEVASFAAPAERKLKDVGESVEKVLEEASADDPFEVLSFLEGGLHLVAYGEKRLMWYPCQLGGRPRGSLRVAACRPIAATLASTGDEIDLPGRRLAGVHADLVGLLSQHPRLGPPEELCEECGREITPDPGRRCPHYRERRRAALAAAAFLPGLGHLVQRRFQRGRWLLVAAVLLLSQLLYMGLPVLLGTNLFHPERYVVPFALYAALWWISWSEVRQS